MHGHLGMNPKLVDQVELDVNTELCRGNDKCHWQVEHLQEVQNK